MDLEIKTIDGITGVLCVSIYDRKMTKSFYISDHVNAVELLISAIRYIMTKKYKGYIVYFHSLSN